MQELFFPPEPDDVSWMKHAACTGMSPDLFFPEKSANNDFLAAKAVCETCPVKAPCLEYALDMGVLGVWGGTSEKQRRKINRERGNPHLCKTCGTNMGPTPRIVCDGCLKEYDRSMPISGIPSGTSRNPVVW